MIFLDSWIWIEFFAESSKAEAAEELILSIDEKGGVVTPTVLMEVRYRLTNKASEAESEKAVSFIRDVEGLEVLPVTTEVGLYAADIRQKYYRRGDCELSYADAIHLATAALAGCEKLYSGDSDFEEVDEIETRII